MDESNRFSAFIEALRARTAASVAILHARYGPVVLGAVREKLPDRLRVQFDSVDFVQEVWILFFTLLDEEHTFKTPQHLECALTQMAHRKVIDEARKQLNTLKHNLSREQRLVGEEGEEDVRDQLVSHEPDPSEWAIAAELWKRLESELCAPHLKILKRLREGYTQEEIAKAANLSVSTINRMVRSAKEKAKYVLEQILRDCPGKKDPR